MSQIIVKGGNALSGSVRVQGAKNSALPILAATLLNRGETVLKGCPRLRDVDASVRILRHLGCEARWEEDTLTVNTVGMNCCNISDALMREMRSSAIFLGAVLARCGQADISYPGGWDQDPLIYIWRASGSWGPTSGRTADGFAAPRPALWGGRWCSACPALARRKI